MSITGGLIAFGVRYVFNESADHVINVIERRLTDHSQALPKALSKANDRAWEAVGLALAGDGLFNRMLDVFRDADIKGVRDQIKKFLDNTPTGLESATVAIRAKATEEWCRLRKAGRFAACSIPTTELALRAATMERHGDPARMTAAAHQAVKETAEAVRSEAPLLADLLTAAPDGGTPLLAAAFAFFFRREVETNSELAHGLSFDFLRQISERQERGLELLDIRTAGILDHIEVLFDCLENWFTINHAKLDEINGKLDELISKRDVATRTTDPLKVSVTNEKELGLLRKWLAELRELPQELIDAALWAKLGDALAAGRILAEARAAQEAAAAAAKAAADRGAEAEAAYKMYRVACEQEEWTDALAGLVRAATLDPARFAPFPLNRYEPVRVLGAGGFGTVVLCRERLKKNREVAVKTLHTSDLGRDLDELFGEAHTVSGLDDPAIIKVIHWDFADLAESRPFLVMEYFPGVSLAAHLKHRGRLSVVDFIAVARNVAEAMAAAHDAGVVHRDLKPGNILVRRYDRSTESGTGILGDPAWDVRVIDFGLAVKFAAVLASVSTSLPQRTRREQSFAGTLEYASPEQKGLIVAPIGPRSDVYSFGKTMIEALLGTLEPVSEEWNVVPPASRESLKTLLEKCVIRDPKRRHGGFGPIAEALALLASDDPYHEQLEAGEQRKRVVTGAGGPSTARRTPITTSKPASANDSEVDVELVEPVLDQASTDESVVTLVVNDHYNITRNLNPWLTEDVCRSSVLTVECVGMAGKSSFRFVPFDKGPAYGMKLTGDADRAAWGRITAAASDSNRVSLRVRFQANLIPVPLLPPEEVQPPACETPGQKLKRIKAEVAAKTEQVRVLLQRYDYAAAAQLLGDFTPEQAQFRDSNLLREAIARRDRLQELDRSIRKLYTAHKFHDPRLPVLLNQYLALKPDDEEMRELAAELPPMNEPPTHPKVGDQFILRIPSPDYDHKPGEIMIVRIPGPAYDHQPGEVVSVKIPTVDRGPKPGTATSLTWKPVPTRPNPNK